MSYPMMAPQPGQPAPRVRPAAVSAAGALLLAYAVVSLISAGIGIAMSGKITQAMTDAYRDLPNGDSVAKFASLGIYLAIGFSLLFAALFVVLALGVRRGSQGLRITAWVVGGIAAFCVSCGALSSATGGFGMNGGSGANAEAAQRASERLKELLPSWYTPVTTMLSVISAICLITALVLLALPASHPYFRKAQPAFIPPPGY